MTPNQIKLIQETWRSVAPLGDAAAQLFYQRLFEIDPSTKPLFAKTDMAEQSGKLLDALGLVVESANALDGLVPFLKDLGRRHVDYGVEDRHYESVGAALLWTLEQALGSAFTNDVRTAWATAYGGVTAPMRQAATALNAKDQAVSDRPNAGATAFTNQ